MKKNFEDLKRNIENKVFIEYGIKEKKYIDNEDNLKETKRKMLKEEFLKQNQSLLQIKKIKKEEKETKEKNEDSSRIKQNNKQIVKDEKEIYVKKNKYQKFLKESLSRQIEDKIKIHGGKRINLNISANNMVNMNVKSHFTKKHKLNASIDA